MEHKNAGSLIALVANSTLRRHLFAMLEVEDLVTLLQLNKEFKEQLLENSHILNQVYYLTFLKPRETFTYAFCEAQEYKSFECLKVDAILPQMQNSLIGAIPVMKQIREQLNRNLRMLVSQQDAADIVGGLFETMNSPCIPIPNLRKETVGDYCNSALQILMAELNWRDNALKVEEQPYRTLKISLLNNHQQILEELKLNKDVLVKLRFQSQFIDSYEEANSPFLNIITLLLTLIDYHLESIRKYLECYKARPAFQLLSQFTRRYNTFRDMVLQLEDKLGFTMELFTKAFNFLEPELQIYPGSSLWRTLMKKWVNKMKEFQREIAQGFIQLLVCSRQRNLHAMIQCENKLEECSPKINSSYIMKHDRLSNKYQICSQQLSVVQSQDTEASTIIMNQYMEYLIDASTNEYSVHWCQSSSQKLGSIYNNNEHLILESTKELYENWKQIFEQSPLLKEAYEKDVEYLRNIIKPNTLSKIIQQANSIIEETFTQSKKLIKGEFEQLDDRIRNLNEKRMIPLELDEEYQQFFDFDKTISLDKIESIISKIGKLQKCQSGQSRLQTTLTYKGEGRADLEGV